MVSGLSFHPTTFHQLIIKNPNKKKQTKNKNKNINIYSFNKLFINSIRTQVIIGIIFNFRFKAKTKTEHNWN